MSEIGSLRNRGVEISTGIYRQVELSQQWPAMKELVPQKQIAVRRAKRIAVSVAILSVLPIGWILTWLISV